MNTGLGRFYEHFDIRKMNKNTWISGVPGETDTPNPPCDGYRVMRYKQAHIGYNEQAIFEKIDDGLGVG